MSSTLPPADRLPTDEERARPKVRPPGHALMRQDWSRLLFLHWEVAPEQLRPLVPAGLELDLYEGKAYVGLIPFTMTGVRPPWAPPLPWLSRSHETNLRTYVHKGGRNPGVWFFSLDASNPVAVVGARAFFGLPYHTARMGLVEVPPGTAFSYTLKRRWPGPTPASCGIRCVCQGRVAPARPGTLEHFLIERYVLYTVRRGRLYRGQVHHAPYPLLRDVAVTAMDESLLAAAGISRPQQPPIVHFSPGVSVEVFALTDEHAPGG